MKSCPGSASLINNRNNKDGSYQGDCLQMVCDCRIIPIRVQSYVSLMCQSLCTSVIIIIGMHALSINRALYSRYLNLIFTHPFS